LSRRSRSHRLRVFNPTLHHGLVGYWKLSETAGSRLDSVGQSPGTAVNTPGSASSVVDLGLDVTSSSSQYVSVASKSEFQALDGRQELHICCWCKIDDTGRQDLVTKWGGSTGASDWSLSKSGNPGGFDMYVAHSTSYTSANAGFNPSTGTWYFVEGVIDNANTAVKAAASPRGGTLDTMVSADYSSGGTLNTKTTAVEFGSISDLSIYSDVTIDEIGIWRRLLGDRERLQLFTREATYPFMI